MHLCCRSDVAVALELASRPRLRILSDRAIDANSITAYEPIYPVVI
jgi:hypothetical protein